jgi:transposase
MRIPQVGTDLHSRSGNVRVDALANPLRDLRAFHGFDVGRGVADNDQRHHSHAGMGQGADVALPIARIGLEAGPLSQWLREGLIQAGFDVVLLETRHVKAALSAMAIKTDRKDARGIAHMLRMGWYRPVHAKSADAQALRTLLAGRKQLQSKLIELEHSIRGLLRGYGLKVGQVSRGRFDARIRELVDGNDALSRVVGALLLARSALWTKFAKFYREMLGLQELTLSAAD